MLNQYNEKMKFGSMWYDVIHFKQKCLAICVKHKKVKLKILKRSNNTDNNINPYMASLQSIAKTKPLQEGCDSLGDCRQITFCLKAT